MNSAFEYTLKAGGLMREEEYPYTGTDRGTCKFDKTKIAASVANFSVISLDKDQIAINLVKNGPLAVAIKAVYMQTYIGGVSCPYICSRRLNHGVLLVGYGSAGYAPIQMKDKPYWIIKNGFYKIWGENGFYKICRGHNVCGVESMVSTIAAVHTSSQEPHSVCDARVFVKPYKELCKSQTSTEASPSHGSLYWKSYSFPPLSLQIFSKNPFFLCFTVAKTLLKRMILVLCHLFLELLPLRNRQRILLPAKNSQAMKRMAMARKAHMEMVPICQKVWSIACLIAHLHPQPKRLGSSFLLLMWLAMSRRMLHLVLTTIWPLQLYSLQPTSL